MIAPVSAPPRYSTAAHATCQYRYHQRKSQYPPALPPSASAPRPPLLPDPLPALDRRHRAIGRTQQTNAKCVRCFAPAHVSTSSRQIAPSNGPPWSAASESALRGYRLPVYRSDRSLTIKRGMRDWFPRSSMLCGSFSFVLIFAM